MTERRLDDTDRVVLMVVDEHGRVLKHELDRRVATVYARSLANNCNSTTIRTVARRVRKFLEVGHD